MSCQLPSGEEWDRMRPIIEDLKYLKGKTYPEVASILASQHGFRVRPSWIGYRLRQWGGGVYFTKNITRRLLEEDAYGLLARDMPSVLKLMKSAIRHNLEVPASYFHCFTIIYNLHITPPPLDCTKLKLFSSISKYVSGAFDNQLWNTENFSSRIAHDFTRWTCDDPPSVFKVLTYLTCATMCGKLAMHDWAQLLVKSGFEELPACLNDQSPEALLVFVKLLFFFHDCMPTEKEKLLRHCISIVDTTHPFREILCRIRDAERQSPCDDFRATLLHNASAIFYNKLRDRLGHDKFGYAIIQQLHSTGERGDFESLRWDDPRLIQREDKTFFNSGPNIERYIVLAVERYGFQELLQIRDTLKRQRDLTASNEVHEVIDKYLTSLERPIQRIGYRDHFGDRDRFIEHWKRTTGDWELTQKPQGPNHIMDMLNGIARFNSWGDKDEVVMIKTHLDHVFLALATNLGETYEIAEGGGLYSSSQEG